MLPALTQPKLPRQRVAETCRGAAEHQAFPNGIPIRRLQACLAKEHFCSMSHAAFLKQFFGLSSFPYVVVSWKFKGL